MTTAKFVQPDFTTQAPSEYKSNIDASIAVLGSIAAQFAPSAPAVPEYGINLEAGRYFNRVTGAVVELAEQVLVFPSYNALTYVELLSDGTLSSNGVGFSKTGWPIATVFNPTNIPTTPEMVVDMRAMATGMTTPSNVFLITSSTTWTAPACNMLRITMSGGGGGGGGGATNPANTSHSGGGGGGGAATIVNRIVKPSDLTIIIGAGGMPGTSGVSLGSTGTAGLPGGTTTVTAADWTLSAAGAGSGGAGTGAATPVAGAAGTAGVAGTGLAGTAGTAGTVGATANGGKGGNTANMLSAGTVGASAALGGSSNAEFGAGGGGAFGYSQFGLTAGKGGDGFVLIEVF